MYAFCIVRFLGGLLFGLALFAGGLLVMFVVSKRKARYLGSTERLGEELEVWRFPCGGVVGIDPMFLDQCSESVFCPYTGGVVFLNRQDVVDLGKREVVYGGTCLHDGGLICYPECPDRYRCCGSGVDGWERPDMITCQFNPDIQCDNPKMDCPHCSQDLNRPGVSGGPPV